MSDEAMHTDMETLRSRLRERAVAFAKNEIEPRDNLQECDRPPEDLWRAFGVSGMTTIGLPPDAGGDGGDSGSDWSHRSCKERSYFDRKLVASCVWGFDFSQTFPTGSCCADSF